MTDLDQIGQAVADGAAWLDGKTPGWRSRVDVETLDIIDCHRCVLGQIFERAARGGFYPDGYTFVTRGLRAGEGEDWAIAHGFTLSRFADDEDWDALQDAWIAELAVKVGD